MAGPSRAWLEAGMPDFLGLGPPPGAPVGPVAINLGGAPAPPPPMAPAPAPAPAPPAPAPAPAPAAPQQPPPAAAQGPQPMPNDVQFVRVGGGATPAREATTMGPQQRAALMSSFEPQPAAADRIAGRAEEHSVREQLSYVDQAVQALKRQETAVAVKQQRTDELQDVAQDYGATIQSLGQQHLDDNRWWAKKTTGDKIATGILAFLGGLGAMGTGGPNLAWEGIKREMDGDIEAQKFDYQTTMDRAKGAQNTYAMALERFGSEDAAEAAARAAALDFALAKTNQLQAQWKGTEALNAADDLRARIESEKQKTIAAGFKYIPAAQQGAKYQMMVRGQMLPGTVSEQKAQEYTLEHGVKPSEAVDLKMVEGGIKAATEKQKGGEEREKRTSDEAKAISSQLQQAGVPQARAAAEIARRALTKSEGGFIEGTARDIAPGAVKVLASQDANAREQAYANFANAAIKSMMGNATESEVSRAEKALGTAKDPAARLRAIDMTLEILADIEKNAKAGASPEAQAEFDRRRATADGAPAAAPKSASTGWSK